MVLTPQITPRWKPFSKRWPQLVQKTSTTLYLEGNPRDTTAILLICNCLKDGEQYVASEPCSAECRGRTAQGHHTVRVRMTSCPENNPSRIIATFLKHLKAPGGRSASMKCA